MLKRNYVLLIIALLVFSFSGCSKLGSTTQKYISAFTNTENAKTIQSRTQSKLEIDLSKASEKVKKDLEKFSEVSFNIDSTVDKKAEKEESNIFFSVKDMMTNAKIYIDKDNLYLKTSMPDTKGKYLKINAKEGQEIAPLDEIQIKEYEKLYNEFLSIWKEAIQNEILSSEGNSIESTPDGEIKVLQLSLELTDEKIKKLIQNLGDLISKSEVLKESSIENAKKYSSDDVDKSEIEKSTKDFFEKLPSHIENLKDKVTVENLKLTAKIDKDMYIIDENLNVDLVINHEGEIRISFDLHTTRWNIDKDVKVNIPQIKDEDVMDEEEFSSLYKDFFKDLE